MWTTTLCNLGTCYNYTSQNKKPSKFVLPDVQKPVPAQWALVLPRKHHLPIPRITVVLTLLWISSLLLAMPPNLVVLLLAPTSPSSVSDTQLYTVCAQHKHQLFFPRRPCPRGAKGGFSIFTLRVNGFFQGIVTPRIQSLHHFSIQL